MLETVLHCEGFRIILDFTTEVVRLQWHTMAFTFAFSRNIPQLSWEISLLTFHRNRSMAPAPPTTPHPLFPVQQVKLNLVAVPPSELRRSFCITYMLQPCAIKDPNALNHDNITDTTQTQKTNETHYQTSSGNHSCST